MMWNTTVVYILTYWRSKFVLFISLLQQSTHPSAFLAGARGTPVDQASDFCHHTVEDSRRLKQEENMNLAHSHETIGKSFY